jgi:hypothetical protein
MGAYQLSPEKFLMHLIFKNIGKNTWDWYPQRWMPFGRMKEIGLIFLNELSDTNYITRDIFLLIRIGDPGASREMVIPELHNEEDGFGRAIQNPHGKHWKHK